MAIAIALCFVSAVFPQSEPTDADLERAGGGRTIAVGALSSDKSISRIPVEVYVARVLAGEAERDAPDGELQALAIAIRTYASFNAGRHSRDGFDLCDTTHCQVPRTATAATRRAALATAAQILTWHGAPAEIFYSASCGGRSESAAEIWSGSDLPYLPSVEDDVHQDDEPWTYRVRLDQIQRLLAQRGFAGRLRDISVASHTSSGRVGSLRLSGLEPGVIAGDQFRLLIGARDLRSTAFSMDRSDDVIEFNGRGYGHGVGMCVIGAGRRARRGESVQQILAQYYPGLEITALGNTSTRVKSETVVTAVNQIPNPKSQIPNPESQLPNPRLAPSSTATAPVTLRGTLQTSELQQAVARAHQAVTRLLGVTAAPVTIDVHDTVEGFRQATGKPWWASASVSGNTVDLAPLTLLAQREGVETTLRAAIAQAVMAAQLQGRPEWVRVGGARYFSHATLPSPPDRNARLRCPADAELTLAISATAQREAEARAEACFARAYAASRDWKAVK